jgi:hypothetical protein
MADQKLTDLPVANTITGSEVLYGVQSGDSVQISTNQLKVFTNDVGELPRGTFASSQTQSIADIAQSQAITYNLSIDNTGITVVDNSKITVQNTGTYVLSLSAIAHNSGSSASKYVNIFMKKNGSVVDNSSTIVNVVKDEPLTLAVTFVVEATSATDYWEFFLVGQVATCELLATPAQVAVPGVSPAQPACPSIIVAAWQVG